MAIAELIYVASGPGLIPSGAPGHASPYLLRLRFNAAVLVGAIDLYGISALIWLWVLKPSLTNPHSKEGKSREHEQACGFALCVGRRSVGYGFRGLGVFV